MDDIEVVREALNRGEQLTSSGWWGDAQASLARIEAQLSAVKAAAETAKDWIEDALKYGDIRHGEDIVNLIQAALDGEA